MKMAEPDEKMTEQFEKSGVKVDYKEGLSECFSLFKERTKKQLEAVI